MATLKADRRLYVTADRAEIVEEGDPRAAYLLVAPGRNIGEGDVAMYRLSMQGGRVVIPGAKKASPPENKMTAPPENKGVRDLSELSKDELVALAEKEEVEVVRRDGEDGEPLKADYIAALSDADAFPASE